MGTKFSAVATGVGGVVTVISLAGVCLSLGAGSTPGRWLVGWMTVGLVMVVSGVLVRFEEQARVWRTEVDRELQARQQCHRLSGATVHPPVPVHARAS